MSDGLNEEIAPGDEPVDGGATKGASGTSADATGGTVTYTVASGDTAVEIAARFDVELDQLVSAEGQRLGSYPVIHPGDVIGFRGRLTGEARNCFYALYESQEKLAACTQKYPF